MFLDGLLLSNPLLRRTKNTAPIYFFIQQVVLSANVFHNNVYFFIHAVGHLYIFPYTQSTSVRTAYIFSYTQSDSCIFLHTHSRTLGQSFDGARKKQFSFKKVRKVFINQGPGKYTSIRTSMAIIKALKLVYGFNYYGFNNKDVVDGDYRKIFQLFKQKKIDKKFD